VAGCSAARLDAARLGAIGGMANIQKRYLSPGEVESVYSVDSKTLADWRYKGAGPAFSQVGRLVRYKVDDLEAFFTGCRVETRPGFH